MRFVELVCSAEPDWALFLPGREERGKLGHRYYGLMSNRLKKLEWETFTLRRLLRLGPPCRAKRFRFVELESPLQILFSGSGDRGGAGGPEADDSLATLGHETLRNENSWGGTG